MNRHPDWNKRLLEYLAEVRRRAHDWKSHNCAQFCAGAVTAMTGETLDIPGFEDAASGHAYLAEHGGMAALVSQYLGGPLPGVLCARVGDIVMAEIGQGEEAVGIVIGAYAAFVADDGLSKIRLGRCSAAWRVG